MTSNDLLCRKCGSHHHPMDFCPASTGNGMTVTGVEAAETYGSASTKAREQSEEWLVDKVDYAERLFKIKQLEYRRDEMWRKIDGVKAGNGYHELLEYNDEIVEINNQISKLLEDE